MGNEVTQEQREELVYKGLQRVESMKAELILSGDSDGARELEFVIIEATDNIDEHPDWYEGSCICNSCKSYC